MKLLGLVFVLVLTGCNNAETPKQQIQDNNVYNNVTDVNQTNHGKAVGKEYGGKGAGYGQVKKIEPGNAVPPIIEAPEVPELTVEQKIKQILESHRMTNVGVVDAPKVAEFDPNTYKQIGWVHNIYIGGYGYLSSEEQAVIVTEIEKITGYDIAKFFKGSDSIIIWVNNSEGERVTPL